jgi:hypothetical protein
VNESAPDLLIDATERRRQRPQDAQKQTEHYSGKKKAHTDKNLLLANVHTRKIVYLSATEQGKKHDKKIADENDIRYPAQATLGKDTGFQGYEPQGVLTFQPKKAKRRSVECGRPVAQQNHRWGPRDCRKYDCGCQALSHCQGCFSKHQTGVFRPGYGSCVCLT